MTDPPHPGEAEVPGTSVDVASETHVQSSNGQEVVNQAVAAVVASVVSRMALLESSYHVSIVLQCWDDKYAAGIPTVEVLGVHV